MDHRELSSQIQQREIGLDQTVDFNSADGMKRIVFGRNPANGFRFGETPPTEIGKDTLPVKLLGTTSGDTSRQQFALEKTDSGFIITNFSKEPLHFESLPRGVQIVRPGDKMLVSPDIQDMQHFKVMWRGGYEISVQRTGFQSDSSYWNLGFLFSKRA